MKSKQDTPGTQAPRITKPDSPQALARPKSVDSLATVDNAMRLISQEVAALTTETAPLVWKKVAKLELLVEEWAKMTKAFIARVVAAEGRAVSEAGTKQLTVGDSILEIQPNGGWIDDKKLEALLRAKHLTPEMGMDVEVKYRKNESKLDELVRTKRLTSEEIDTCRTPIGWKVMKVK
jgi:hypothetical protein